MACFSAYTTWKMQRTVLSSGMKHEILLHRTYPRNGWCDRMTTGAVFGFLSFIVYMPSAALNTANSCGPW